MKPFDGSATTLKSIRRALLGWYSESKRDLPWRNTRDPYAIWVSEIMLQQTRVVAVLEHYQRFLSEFSSVEALARAPLDKVLAAWSGLGYYRRAKALHAAAILIVHENQGQLPTTREGLLQLPGIGRYTSAAIASIAFGQPHAVVDGNVERVLTRLDGKKRTGEDIWQRAEELLDRRSPGDWNQAVMELGATICTPVGPVCDACPVKQWCTLPGHDVRQSQPVRRKRELVLGLARRGKSVYLVQRPAGASLMPLMWELPELQSADGRESVARLRHSITVHDYKVGVVKLPGSQASGGQWVPELHLEKLALTGLARKALKHLGIISSSRHGFASSKPSRENE